MAQCSLPTRAIPPASQLPNAVHALCPQVEQAGGVRVAWIDATLDRVWAPELLRYDVEAVPCLVLLRGDGHAVCKTGQPSTARQMAADMEQMLREVGA